MKKSTKDQIVMWLVIGGVSIAASVYVIFFSGPGKDFPECKLSYVQQYGDSTCKAKHDAADQQSIEHVR